MLSFFYLHKWESKFSDKVSKKLQDNIVSLISLSYKIWIKIFSSIILSSQVHSYFSTLYEGCVCVWGGGCVCVCVCVI